MEMNFGVEWVSEFPVSVSEIHEIGDLNNMEKTRLNQSRIKRFIRMFGLASADPPYYLIRAITVAWKPSVSHLLTDAIGIVEIHDQRTDDMNKVLGAVSIPLDCQCTATFPMEISVPTSEMRRENPIRSNMTILGSLVKEGHEMGMLSVKMTTLGVKSGRGSELRMPTLIVSNPPKTLTKAGQAYFRNKGGKIVYNMRPEENPILLEKELSDPDWAERIFGSSAFGLYTAGSISLLELVKRCANIIIAN